ncbi:hypothetical protein NQ317_008367 [Molorchus minor]|uniref:Myotubularin phosphatase domain-containing protein n=1 Tax=Molorchus minor TaxID=1323400 RepID=A0ABQ9K441_9CUCU|nr:hypothetical protein NQ317_008367 [Molorchus minor]
MNDIKEDSRFKSYISENELESIILDDSQRTKFLDGETIVCEAQKVLLYPPLSDRKKYIAGVLTVTTFKLSFATAEEAEPSNCYQQNLLLGVNDICLSSIDVIYQVGDRTKKKLSPGQNVTGKIKDIVIVCKNMKYLEFSFKLSDKDSGKNIVNALLHHAYPKRHTLLFAYDYKEPYVNETLTKEVRLFLTKQDWEKELRRTKCQNWRVSQVNFNYQVSPLLIETIIVPKSVTDSIIREAVEKFRNRCGPIWVYGTPTGAALVRMADLLPAITDRTEENKLLEHIRKSHPGKRPPHIIDLSFPSPKDVQNSYLKLRDLCVPDNTRVFKSQDFKFYGLLDGTKWLSYVSTCLQKAREAVVQMSINEVTVVLQEGNGQDLNCVVSSLTQIMLDPYFRTKFGFQSLIQKEWIALGHPFANRLGHILCKDVEQSPIFLLFLDCVWQLLQQFPAAFQISETYLTTLWDSAHVSVFDTFLFNCHHQRFMAEVGSANSHPPLVLRSVWDWREQFSDRDIGLFCNPLYDDSYRAILKPHVGLAGLDVWTQCYFRWLPDLEVRTGGRPQVDLYCRFLVAEILQRQQGIGELNGRLSRNKEEYVELVKKVNGFFPFSHNSGFTDTAVRSIMSGSSLNFLRKLPRNSVAQASYVRNYSRKVSNSEGSYKHVKPRKTIQETSDLVWRDPNFELLASNGFPLFLRGNIGLAWYDTQTTVKTHHELIMEQIDDTRDNSNANMICRVQPCPTVLRKTVGDLFPYRPLEESTDLSVITITLKPNSKLIRTNAEVETEKLAQMFLISAKNICDKLRGAGYWADFINPFSGLPYFTPYSLNELYKTDEKFRCLDFQIFDIKDCKVVSNEDKSKKRFVGSLFSNAPCKMKHLNSIFTGKE